MKKLRPGLSGRQARQFAATFNHWDKALARFRICLHDQVQTLRRVEAYLSAEEFAALSKIMYDRRELAWKLADWYRSMGNGCPPHHLWEKDLEQIGRDLKAWIADWNARSSLNGSGITIGEIVNGKRSQRVA